MLNYAALITTTVHNGIDPETLQAQKKKKKNMDQGTPDRYRPARV